MLPDKKITVARHSPRAPIRVRWHNALLRQARHPPASSYSEHMSEHSFRRDLAEPCSSGLASESALWGLAADGQVFAQHLSAALRTAAQHSGGAGHCHHRSRATRALQRRSRKSVRPPSAIFLWSCTNRAVMSYTQPTQCVFIGSPFRRR